MIVHLVARAWPGVQPLQTNSDRWWLWRRLRRRFGEVLAACLMPQHLHLLLECERPDAVRRQLGKLLSGVTRRLQQRRCWMPVPEPTMVLDRQHLARQVRYIHLNPCRAGLVNDPLGWPWSTHRGIIGAEGGTWVTPAKAASSLGRSTKEFAQWFHGYVSSDPSVSVVGTSLPIPAPRRSASEVPLRAVVDAARLSGVWLDESARRKLAAMLAQHQGWLDANSVGPAIRLHPQTVRRLWRDAHQHPIEPDHLAAAKLCLGDSRLRESVWSLNVDETCGTTRPPDKDTRAERLRAIS